MKFKSRPVKVEQPPPHNHPYLQNISATAQTPPQLASTTVPATFTSTTTNPSTWTKPSLTLSQATSPLFSIIRPSASGSNTSSSLSTSTISSLTDTFSASLPLITPSATASMVEAAVKSLNPLPMDRTSIPTTQENILVPLSPTIGSNNAINEQIVPDIKSTIVQTPVIRSVGQDDVSFSTGK